MRDGLYCARFQTQLGSGAGIATLRDGRIGGGDSALFYVGSYSEIGNQFTADVLTDRHSQGAASVFGVDKVQINLTGTTQGDTAKMIGTSPQAPGVTFQASLTRIAD